MQIGRKDLLWNYAATGMRLLSGIIVLPITLRMFPSETMGIWSIFLSLTAILSLLDFGFSNAFSRNVSYVFSGVKELKTKGYANVETSEIDYGLLKSLLSAMRRYYGVLALIFLLLFIAVSPLYLSSVLDTYHGETKTIWIAWFVFGGVLAYELYTYYYNTILTGRGLIKRNMQIIVISQSVRIISTVILLYFKLQIIALVLGILIGDLVNRTLSYSAFYDKELKKHLAAAKVQPVKDIIKILAPNAIKVGGVALSYFFINQAIVLISPLYLSWTDVAEYGISKQIISIMVSFGFMWFGTFYPQLAQFRVKNQLDNVKRFYIKSQLNLLLVFVVLGILLLFFGQFAFDLMHSKTHLLCNKYLLLMIVFSFFEVNQNIAINMLLSKNEVPYFKSLLITAISGIVILFALLNITSLGVLALILAPNIALCTYQNWKWTIVVNKEVQLKVKDYFIVISNIFKL
jgi:O-antigen/teichoic acid export membrane protein